LPNSARERKWHSSIPAPPADRRRIGLTRLPQRFVPGVTESQIQAGGHLINQLCLPLPCLSHSGNILFSGTRFRNFSHDTLAWIAPPAMAGNTTVVVLRFPSRDSRPSLMSRRRQKQEKMASTLPKKTG
jgi:hypothetical protein